METCEKKVIGEFRGEYDFLSNFYESPVTYGGITYTSAEAAFQAQKVKNPKDREAFANLGPSDAKKRGRAVPLRADWQRVKIDIMEDVLRAKFAQDPLLRLRLLATGDARLEEGNTWGDRYWGVSGGEGENRLGLLLMRVREEFFKEGPQLVILERENGFYGGYEARDGCIAQVFNSDAKTLFVSVKAYTDRGYRISCLDKSCEGKFMAGRPVLGGVM